MVCESRVSPLGPCFLSRCNTLHSVHRMGKEGKFDLKLADPPSQSPSENDDAWMLDADSLGMTRP